MGKKIERFIIPFEGLSDGIHEFEFLADTAFFSLFDKSLIDNAEIEVNVIFEKKPNMFQLQFNFVGVVHTFCDRCLDKLELSIKGEQNFIVKLSEKSIDDEDDIISISQNAQELDLSHRIYESIHLLMPLKVVHQDIKECDPTIIAKLNTINLYEEETEKIDPRWEQLNKIR